MSVNLDAPRKSLPIPWLEIVALRNRLIHGYNAVDLDILWDIAAMDLPPLIEALRGITEEA